VRRTLPPSAELERKIDELLAGGVAAGDAEGPLSELASLGAKLIIQRAVEEEFDTWLGRARYERRPEAPPGKRNGWRPRRVQSAEGARSGVEVPQLREAAEAFTSKLFPRGSRRLLATEPLRAMVVGAFVRGLSMRDVESLCEEAGLGQVSKSSAARICRELRDRFRAVHGPRPLRGPAGSAVPRCDLPAGPSLRGQGGRAVRLGVAETGERVLLCVCLGMRESEQDWLALGRDLAARGLPAPLLVVADGAPGLIAAIEQLWPGADRQRCTVHRLRNLLAKLPKRERERVRLAYWRALDEATDEADGRRRLGGLIDELDRAGFASAAACLAEDLGALVVHLRYPLRHRRRWRSTDESVKGPATPGPRFGAAERSRWWLRGAGDRLLWARFPRVRSTYPVFGVERPSPRRGAIERRSCRRR
jgi:putative transposase